MKLNAKTQLQELVWGLFARVVNVLVPVQKGHWIFASDYGRQCREGSKYLLEYMLREHSDYHCTFVTRNSDVREMLSKKGIPCVMNFSWKGILSIARAEAVFFTQYCDDVYFAYRKPYRKHYFPLEPQCFRAFFYALHCGFRMFSFCFRNYFTTFRVLCQPHLCDTYLSPENNIYTTDADEMCSYQIRLFIFPA